MGRAINSVRPFHIRPFAFIGPALITAIILGGCGSPGKAGERKGLPPEGIPSGSHYVALGSSFAAGPRIPPALPTPCLRSGANYPHLLAAAMKLELTDVSCAGATILSLSKPSPGGIPAQTAAVTPSTRLVTVTVGGNDLSYAQDLTRCTAAAAVHRSCLHGGRLPSEGSQRLVAARTALTSLFAELHRLGPRARIVLVGYLAVLPADARPCPPSVPLEARDAKALGQLGNQLNLVMRQAAAAAQVAFLDVYTSSRDRSACALPAQRWVEGNQPASSAFRYHPNARGMAAVATLLGQFLKD